MVNAWAASPFRSPCFGVGRCGTPLAVVSRGVAPEADAILLGEGFWNLSRMLLAFQAASSALGGPGVEVWEMQPPPNLLHHTAPPPRQANAFAAQRARICTAERPSLASIGCWSVPLTSRAEGALFACVWHAKMADGLLHSLKSESLMADATPAEGPMTPPLTYIC